MKEVGEFPVVAQEEIEQDLQAMLRGVSFAFTMSGMSRGMAATLEYVLMSASE